LPINISLASPTFTESIKLRASLCAGFTDVF
jgi:hypothetical protein